MSNANPDLSSNWEEAVSQGSHTNPHLPRNILGSLEKVVDREGRLTFERFCAGLKIAILRHEAQRNKVVASEKRREDAEEATRPRETPVISRTSSLPNVFSGHLSPFVASAVAAPSSPVPSEPCRSTGPPKPPRDPLRMSGTFLRQDASSADNSQQSTTTTTTKEVTRRPLKRRDSHQHRRHTVQGGIDLSMVREIAPHQEYLHRRLISSTYLYYR